MTAGEDKSRDVDTAVEDLRRYKAHLSEIARYEPTEIGQRMSVIPYWQWVRIV